MARHQLQPTLETCAELIKGLANQLGYEPGDNPLLKGPYVVFAESVLGYFTQEDGSLKRGEHLALLVNNLALIYQALGQVSWSRPWSFN